MKVVNKERKVVMTKNYYLRKQARRKAKRDKITGAISVIIIMTILFSAMLLSYEYENSWNDAHPTIRYGSTIN